jgi:hypothetical protein
MRVVAHAHAGRSKQLTAGMHDVRLCISPSRNAPMPTEITQAELARIRDWANRQQANGGEQPWSVFLLTRLGETIDALLVGMAATQADRSPQATRYEATPRLVVSNAPQDCGSGRRLQGKKTKPRITEPAV